jgi:hypothetical protein
MTFINKKNKLKDIYNQTLDNENQLSKKEKIYNTSLISLEGFKTPKIMYDSGWLTPSDIIEGG